MKCKDCGGVANPSLTMCAADYGCAGPDLHFCDPCNEAGDLAFTLMEKLLSTNIAKHLTSKHAGGMPN